MILNLTIRIEYNLQEKEKRNNKHTYIAAYRQWKFQLCKYTMNIILERIRENKHSMSNSCQEICPSWTFCNTIFCMVDCLQGKSWSKCRAMCFYLLNIFQTNLNGFMQSCILTLICLNLYQTILNTSDDTILFSLDKTIWY